METLNDELSKLKPHVQEIELLISMGATGIRLEKLRKTRNQINNLLSRATSMRNSLNELLLDDRVMSLMNFSKIVENPNLYTVDVPEEDWVQDNLDVEMLVESYLQLVESILTGVNIAKRSIEGAESDLLLKLDSARNKLLRVEMTIQAVTASCAIGSVFAGCFGMNLVDENTFQPGLFWPIFGVITCSCFVMVTLFMAFVMYKGYMIT